MTKRSRDRHVLDIAGVALTGAAIMLLAASACGGGEDTPVAPTPTPPPVGDLTVSGTVTDRIAGGAIDGSGPIVVGGRVYVNSGYARFGQLPGNALLAFAVE